MYSQTVHELVISQKDGAANTEALEIITRRFHSKASGEAPPPMACSRVKRLGPYWS